MAFPHEKIFRELKEAHPGSDVDVAFKKIYLHTFSYASTGTAFKRQTKELISWYSGLIYSWR